MSTPSKASGPAAARTLFIGGGNMARSLIGGMTTSGVPPARIHVVEPRAEARAELAASFGVAAHASAAEAGVLEAADNLVLAVKPQIIRAVCAELDAGRLPADALVLTIAAGVRLEQIARWLGGARAMVRVMPNTPALIGAGAMALCANARASAAQRSRAEAIFRGAGLVRWVEDEALMDTVTALSGSGPAYFFAFVEALEAAAAAQGLPAETARALAAQTCLGAGRMLVESGDSPAELRRKVTSPGGTTAAGLASFTADELPAVVARAVAAATRRGGELAAELDP